MILAPTSTSNNRDGNGKFGTLARKAKKASEEEQVEEFVYLDKIDTRMRFNNSKDPIYFAFEHLEQRSVQQLAVDFVKDSLFEITNFVSKVVK